MRYRLVETCEWLIEASSPAEAAALWLDKAEECAEFNGVTERELLDEHDNPCDVSEEMEFF